MNVELGQIVHRGTHATGKRRAEARRPPRTRRIVTILRGLVLAMLCMAAPAAAQDAVFEAIRDVESAMARIGYRLATANAPLCDRLAPGLGLVLHTPEQYAPALRDEAVRHFGFAGPVGVEAVIAGSPAAAAGVEPDDTLLGIGTARFATEAPGAAASTASLIRAEAQIAALPADAPLELHGQRSGKDYVRTIAPVPACRTRFEVAIGPDFTAKADGDMVQIGSRFFEDYPEEQVAAVIAHEFAHNILRHRERLEVLGVSFGLMSGLGRNVRYFRQTELEADILSVALLANAGYDPDAAVRFWEDFGPRHAGGILRSRSHPAWRDRLATIAAAIAALGPDRPARPAIVDSRDRPLDGDWQSLLVRAR